MTFSALMFSGQYRPAAELLFDAVLEAVPHTNISINREGNVADLERQLRTVGLEVEQKYRQAQLEEYAQLYTALIPALSRKLEGLFEGLRKAGEGTDAPAGEE